MSKVREPADGVPRKAPNVEIEASFVDVARREVDDLHAFFQTWYRGKGSMDLERVASALASELELLAPTDECSSRGAAPGAAVPASNGSRSTSAAVPEPTTHRTPARTPSRPRWSAPAVRDLQRRPA